jgi:hypothetical protein
MLCSVFIINPGSMAVKMDALGQYLFQALQLDLCDERLDYWAPKMIGICVASSFLKIYFPHFWSTFAQCFSSA